jgi:hypothetical protein
MPVSSPLVQSPALTALRQSPIPALRKLTVDESDTAVIILGKVGSYYLKQLAQETVMPVLDGRELLNRVVVVRNGAAGRAAAEW